jgi:glycosyltransferase involved in cell wall biosynthesis
MNTPLISVILPVYNGELYIADALHSVLGQRYQNLEIFVIDDGSTDGTQKVLKPFEENVQYYFQENEGPASARNNALRRAKGDFITFIDADDVWHPEKLSNQLHEFQRYPDLSISLGMTFKSKFEKPESINISEARKKATFNLLLGCTLIRRKTFESVGLLDEDLQLGDDTDWFFRAYEKQEPIAVCREIVLLYRMHEDNYTNNKKLFNRSFFQVLKKAKDRKIMANDNTPLPNQGINNMDALIKKWHTAESDHKW